MRDPGQRVIELRQRLEAAKQETTRLQALQGEAERRLAELAQELRALDFDPDGDLAAQLEARAAEVEAQLTELEGEIARLKDASARRADG